MWHKGQHCSSGLWSDAEELKRLKLMREVTAAATGESGAGVDEHGRLHREILTDGGDK